MKRLVCIISLLCFEIMFASCSNSCTIEGGKRLELESKTNDAIACYKSLLETKDSTAAYERLSVIYGRRGDYEEAILYGKKVFTSNQQNLSNKMNLGDWYFKTGNADNALNYFLMVERVDSLFPALNYNLAVIYLTKFDAPQLARKHIERELRAFGDSEENYALLGQIYFQLNLYENSEIAYSYVIKESPNNEAYYFQRAILYYYWEKDAEAISDLDSALMLDPKFVDAMLLKIDIGVENDASFVCDLINQVENYSTLSNELLEIKNDCREN